jgi:predicted HTH domain antitoxin
MKELADRIDQCEEFGLQEVIDTLRDGADTLEKALQLLAMTSQVIRDDMKKDKDDGELH